MQVLPHFDILHLVLLGGHVLAGTLALVAGFALALRPKGDANHRALGRWFVRMMLVVGVTAVALAFFSVSMFMVCIAVFSTYLAWTGGRITRLQRRSRGGDTAAALMLALTGAALLGYGIAGTDGTLVPAAFGVLIVVQAAIDLRLIRAASTTRLPQARLLSRHISAMGGALIATWTAVLVINVRVPWPWLPWLLPSVLGSVLITLAIRRHVRRPVRAVAER